jgi:uncharacterized protein YdeI (YjbR/CyaY-like superfamily)
VTSGGPPQEGAWQKLQFLDAMRIPSDAASNITSIDANKNLFRKLRSSQNPKPKAYILSPKFSTQMPFPSNLIPHP